MYLFKGKKYYTLDEFDEFVGKVVKKAQQNLREELNDLDNINKHYANV